MPLLMNLHKGTVMTEHMEPKSGSSSYLIVNPAGQQVIAEKQPEWDTVSEASWESFPASDPPAWIGRRSAEPPARRTRAVSRRYSDRCRAAW